MDHDQCGIHSAVENFFTHLSSYIPDAITAFQSTQPSIPPK